MCGLYFCIFLIFNIYSAAADSTAASKPNIEIISPFRHEIVALMESSTDGDKGVTMTIRYKINNFLVPRDGVLKVRSNALSQEGLFLSTYNEVKDGILRLKNVQAGTHVIFFQLIGYIDSSKKKGFEVYSTNTLFEVVPSVIKRFYPPTAPTALVASEKLDISDLLGSPNKPTQYTLAQESGMKTFPHIHSLSELANLYREKRIKKYRNKSKMRIAFVGTLVLDGQKTIWMEQWKKIISTYDDMFEITFYCFACANNEEGPLLKYLSSFNIPYLRTGRFIVKSSMYYDDTFPENLYALLREQQAIALKEYGEISGLQFSSDATTRMFYEIFVKNLVGKDILIFANSRDQNDRILLFAAKMAGVIKVVMDLPNLYPNVGNFSIDACIGPSTFAINHFSMKSLRAPLYVVNPGVSDFIFRGRFRKLDVKTGMASANIGFIGRMESEKSPGLFLYAINYLKQKLKLLDYGTVHVTMIGDGSLLPELKKMSFREMNFSVKEVKFVGWIKREDMSKTLDSLDLVVQTSLRDSETFGISNIEAMARGIPIVNFGYGGALEYTEHLVTGYVVDLPNSTSETGASGIIISLADAIFTMLTNATLYETISINALNLVKKNFRNDQMIDKYLRIYLNLLLGT